MYSILKDTFIDYVVDWKILLEINDELLSNNCDATGILRTNTQHRQSLFSICNALISEEWKTTGMGKNQNVFHASLISIDIFLRRFNGMTVL